MKVTQQLLIFLIALLIVSCAVDGNPGAGQQEDSAFSIVRKWYFNSSDDRYSYDFTSNGALAYHYSNSGRFVTEMGSWGYGNAVHTSLLVRLPNEVDLPYTTIERNTHDAWYTIVEAKPDSLVLQRDPSGTTGRGLGNTTELLKSISGPSRILPGLVGKWYYDSTRDGRWLYFEDTGNCYYYHYQVMPGDGWWVSSAGVWYYNADGNTVSIFMSGELTYSYSIDELTSNTLKLGLTDSGAGTIFTATVLYR